MSNSGSEKPIENAVEVIKVFGGIRPMSSKTGVAVTTIQGWKKRNVIPANRVDAIKTSAFEHGLDLSGLVDGVQAPDQAVEISKDDKKIPENQLSEESFDAGVKSGAQSQNGLEQNDFEQNSLEEEHGDEDQAEAEVEAEAEDPATVQEGEDIHETSEDIHETKDNPDPVEAASDESGEESAVGAESKAEPGVEVKNRPQSTQYRERDYAELVMEHERKGVAKGVLMVAGVILVLIGIVAMMIIPKFKERDQHVAELEQQLNQMQRQQSVFKGLMPEDWSKQLAELKKEMADAKNMAAPAVETVKNAANDIVGPNSGSIQQRVEKLQSYVNDITESTSVSSLYARLDEMRGSATGRNYLDKSMDSLGALLAGVPAEEKNDPDAMNALLNAARGQSDALGKTFSDVPADDMKAAAMLLALTQLRASLNRQNVPFEDDLAVMMGLVSKDDVELRASLQRLSPYAKEGILSPEGLSNEFRGLAGDVVAASLKGEDVSLMDKAKARMNELLAIEKDGQLMTGTQTQATLNSAQRKLDDGQVSSAIDILKTGLDAQELAPLRPWMDKAQALLTAQNAKQAIQQAIELNLGRGFLGGSELLRNDNAGH